MTESSDPILEARTKVGRWVSLGLRTGYGLFGVTIILFAAAMIADFTPALTSAMTFCLVVGSAILAPSIVFNYGVKAANRADRDGTW